MKRKHLTETLVCPQERLVIISYTTGLSFAKERIGLLAVIITTIFYLLALYLFALPNTPENPFASIYSETLIKITCQHLQLLVGFDTLIYRKYYDTPPILVGHRYAPPKRRPGRPTGSKNKPKASSTAPGPSAPPHNASPPPLPKVYSFFYIADAQYREIQRVPLKFTKFMDGRELREAIFCEHSGGGTPYEVEVWYDGAGEMYFKGGWSQFAEDHDLHQGFFMTFDYHVGTSKFDVRIYDCTQCQKEYEAEVHFH
jgi:hypothetical protein